MKNKGFTVVELIVSFALVMMVVIMLLQIVTIVKTLYVNAGIKTELLSKQAIMSRKINQKFNTKSIKTALRCGEGCLTFIYEDNTSSVLKIDKKNNKFTFTDNEAEVITYTTKLLSGSRFGDIDIRTETLVGVSDGKNNSMIYIHIPITHSLVEGDFGINIVYQYDSRITSISDIVFDDSNILDNGTIVLKGASDMTVSSGLTYVDPGYFVIDEKGSICEPAGTNTCGVIKTDDSEVGNTPNTVYNLTFKLIKDGVVVDEKVRKVLVVDNTFKYDYTGVEQMFTSPKKGVYKIELWGASGGSHNGTGGNGSYTTGEITLEANEKLYVYVGERPTYTSGMCYETNQNAAFNGNINGTCTGGGGATDVRLVAGDWSSFDSLKSRIMVAAGGGGAYYAGKGGDGGALTGLNGLGTASSNNATGGSGAGQTTGSFGMGSGGTSSGGGGYYGGFGIPSGNAGGGSSFISGLSGCQAIDQASTLDSITHLETANHYSGKVFANAKMIAGNETMPNPRGTENITGNDGHGYARITLVSVLS